MIQPFAPACKGVRRTDVRSGERGAAHAPDTGLSRRAPRARATSTCSAPDGTCWWQVLGSNQRRRCRQIYSLLPLATRATCHAGRARRSETLPTAWQPGEPEPDAWDVSCQAGLVRTVREAPRQGCPKRMVQGPCGGVRHDGRCEMVAAPCVFLAPDAWPAPPKAAAGPTAVEVPL